MSYSKSSAEIEREIEEERSELTRSIEELQNQFSPERIVSTITGAVRENGSDVAYAIGKRAKENPIALALTGIGLAWLIAGSGGGQRLPKHRRIEYRDYDDYEDYDDEFSTSRRRVGYASPTRATAPGSIQGGTPEYREFDRRVEAAQQEIRYRDYAGRPQESAGPGLWGRLKSSVSGAYEGAKDVASSAADSVTSAASSATSSVSSAAGTARDGVTSTGSSIAGKAQSGGRHAYMRASDMRDRLWEGTENMSAAARDRVVAARSRALEAQARIESAARRRSEDLRRLAEDEPLLLGAIAFAVGAAAGALMPRTDVEDEYLGEYRDDVFARADAIFREESEKLKKVASAAAEEGKAIVDEKLEAASKAAERKLDEADDHIKRAKDSYETAKEKADEKLKQAKTETPTGREAVEKVEGEVRTAADRVGEAAKTEAERQNLGKTH